MLFLLVSYCKWLNFSLLFKDNSLYILSNFSLQLFFTMNTGVYQYGGMACCVMINDSKSQEKICFVTSSDVVAYLKADKKPTEMHPFLKKKMKGCYLVGNSTVNNFGPFSFLSMHVQSSPGLTIKPDLTRLDFQVPKQDLVSEFEAYTFIGTNPMKLKFVCQRATGKYILSTTLKNQLELPFVLGAPIIIENKDVTSKSLSSRWPVVGVMGLNEDLELCPYFVTVDIFGEFCWFLYNQVLHSAAGCVNKRP